MQRTRQKELHTIGSVRLNAYCSSKALSVAKDIWDATPVTARSGAWERRLWVLVDLGQIATLKEIYGEVKSGKGIRW